MKTLLFCEASPARAGIARELHLRGHEVLTATDAGEAWRLWLEHAIALALVAARVGGTSTLDFCCRLRRPPTERHALVLLIVPAHQEPRELQPFVDAGVDGWLPEDALEAHASLYLTLAERCVGRIDERQKFRDALARALAWQEAIFEGSRDAVFISDEQSRFTIVNRAACELTSYSREELLGMRIPDLHSPTDLEAYRRFHARIMAGEDMVSQARILRRDGGTVETEFNNRCIVIGGTKYMHSVARDITERKRFEQERLQLEAQIQHLQKLESLGVLAGGVAHDFNNLLVGILGNASLLVSDLPATSPMRDALQQIESAAMCAADLTKQLLAYSGKGKFVLERVVLSELVAGMGSLLASVVGSNVVLKMNVQESLPPVVADPSELRQVVMNLVTNASEAIGDQLGRVVVSTELVHADRALLASTYLDDGLPEGAYVSLVVEDTGTGMDKAVCDRIFEPFYSTKFPGRGLGLPAVLGIVRSHRGAAKVESQPGHATKVRVLLPVANLAGESDTQEMAVRPGASAEVLIVDDDATVRAVAKQILERSGYTVFTASDGQQAVQLFRERARPPAVVLLDLMMPNMSGAETFRQLRAISPGVGIIMSSGFAESDASLRTLLQDRSLFLQKPYRPAELVARVRSILEGAGCVPER